jgi:hypothetical protein
MLMALKSSLDWYEYSCSCGHFTSNSIVVTHESKHQTFIHFAFLVDMVSIYKFMMQMILVSLIKSLIQWWYGILLFFIKSLVEWFHGTHTFYDQILGAIFQMLFCFKLYKCHYLFKHSNRLVNGFQ